jgi:Mn2+/Fe2+ NRAMP family transporter
MSHSSRVSADRDILLAAQQKGGVAVPAAYLRLSGPGWLQSAITLGGGSLGSALYLGVLGGTSMLWLNLIAIIVGVIMLSAISYVVLSSGKRPYQAINEHVNPVLGVGWIAATIMANIIWCMPQFSLCFDVLYRILFVGSLRETDSHQYGVSLLLFLPAFAMVWLSLTGGRAIRVFDLLLKLLIGMVVVCFVAAVVKLTMQNELNWAAIGQGLLPDVRLWFRPAPEIRGLVFAAPESVQYFWTDLLMRNQRDVMISTTATVVGINMTFLLPYSMLNRGWDKPFRGLARFDLITGMAIPFVLVTGCIVISAAYSFHAEADESFLSSDPVEVQNSRLFAGSVDTVLARMKAEDPLAMDELNAIEDPQQRAEATRQTVAGFISNMSEEERKLTATLVKPDAGQLAQSLAPLLGERTANLVFGLGAFGMGFSTIIILMLINGFAFGELFGLPDSKAIKLLGAAVAGGVGVCWPLIWDGASRTWLLIMASTFGAIFLPIAYIAFFALMNSRSLLKDDMPEGGRRFLWNFLMVFGVIAALAQAGSSLYTKLIDPTTNRLITPDSGSLVFGGVATFALLALIGFSATRSKDDSSSI